MLKNSTDNIEEFRSTRSFYFFLCVNTGFIPVKGNVKWHATALLYLLMRGMRLLLGAYVSYILLS